MKLAEALQERADLNRKIEQLCVRLNNNAIVQEGENPAENPQDLLNELNDSVERLENVIARINKTNCVTIVEGKSITELIAKKDCLMLKLRAYKELACTASQTAHRAGRKEIKILSTVDVKKIQKEIDIVSKELRLTDNKIQEMNWKTELL